MPVRALFVLKFHSEYGYGCSYASGAYVSSGLFNSAQFVSQMLKNSGIDSKVVQVVDNNDIDREVTAYKPTHVFIEALWVVPEKFEVLRRLHPHVKWIVRIHSEVPFLANEGIAIDWISRYTEQEHVFVAANSNKAASDLRAFVTCPRKVLYLPNYYPAEKRHTIKHEDYDALNVACFGAIRPLKNQLIQAVAAIKFADIYGYKLRFHINGTRCEMGGGSILKNLRALFEVTGHELVEHGWMTHHRFLHELSKMDIGLAVSYSETFNIVTADMVTMGLPVVTSSEIPWISRFSVADPNSTESIVKIIDRALDNPIIKKLNLWSLQAFSKEAKHEWLKYLNK